MKISKVLLVIGILYSWAMAIKMIILSVVAIMAYNCIFTSMNTQPLAYLLHLMYFRSKHCQQKISWTFLGLDEQNLPFVEPELPLQASAVTRTFTLAVLYLNLNILLTLFAIASLLSMRKNRDGKIFKIAFTGVVLISALVLTLDFVAMTMNIFDCLRARTSDGLMEILEIQNPFEVRPMFEAIPSEQRIMPSIIMTFATSKGILLLILNVILMAIVISTNWIIRKEKARTQNFSQQRTTISSKSVQLGMINSAFTPN